MAVPAGLDFSAGALARAAPRTHGRRAALITADAARLPFADASICTAARTLTLRAMPARSSNTSPPPGA